MQVTQLLHHDTDLLRQLDAAHRPRVHDDRGRHPRAPSQAARRRDVLPDAEPTSTAPGLPGGRGAGARPEDVSSIRSPSPGKSCLGSSMPTTTSSSARPTRAISASSRTFIQRIYDNGYIYQDVYAGSLLRRLEARSRPRRSCRRQMSDSRRPSPSGSRRRTTSSSSSAVLSSPARPLRRAARTSSLPRFRLQRGALVHRRAACRIFSLSRAGQPWGVPVPWDEEQVVYVWVDAAHQLS